MRVSDIKILGSVNVLVYARTCDPECMRYRSGEINHKNGYICKCMFL